MENRKLGEVYFAPLDVILSDETVVQPDLLFVSKERSEILGKWVHGAPDLVVEIISPDSKERDRLIKKALYEKHKVKEYWMVDLERQCIEVHVLRGEPFELFGIFFKEDLLSCTPLFPDLQMPVASVFSD